MSALTRPTLTYQIEGVSFRRRSPPTGGQYSTPINIQAHTKTHTWYFNSDRLVDFHHPTDDYYWLYWNHYTSRKPGWLTEDFRTPVPWGTPVYEFGQTLLKPRYFEDAAVTDAATSYVQERGGVDFFARLDWRNELREAMALGGGAARSGGRYESAEEYRERITEELVDSRQLLEAGLEKPVEFLCWPCGEHTPELQRFALETGYLATVSTTHTGNRAGDDPTKIRRLYFGQDYRGPSRAALTHMHFCGQVNYHSGMTAAFPLAPVARRLMWIGSSLRQG